MSVDKFGRHEDSLHRKGLRGPPGQGFLLTEDGNYDMNNKLICNLGEPVLTNDAVTKNYVQSVVLEKTQTGDYNFNQKRITNLGAPSLKELHWTM